MAEGALAFYNRMLYATDAGKFAQAIERQPLTATQEDWDKLGTAAQAEFPGGFAEFKANREATARKVLASVKAKLAETKTALAADPVFPTADKAVWSADIDEVMARADAKLALMPKQIGP